MHAPAAAATRKSSWWFPGICLILTGWCANQYVSLIGWYQQYREMSEFTVFLVLAAYVVGLLPMLVFGGAWADRFGRKPFTLLALGASILGSLLLILGGEMPTWLYAGRVSTGVGMGLAMVAATSWIKELQIGPGGAMRAGVCTSLGFALGPVISATVVGASTSPELAYLVHAISAAAWLALVSWQPDAPRVQRATHGAGTTTAENMAVFRRVVLPMAPWVFGVATSGFAVVTALTGRGQGAGLLFSTVTVALTFTASALIQPLARRWDRPRSVRLLVIGLGTAMAAYLVMIPVALNGSMALGVLAAALAGCANGILLLGGLGQVLALAGPAEIGKLTGRFYSVCYIGFLIPTLLSIWRFVADPVYFIGLLVLLCAVSLMTVLNNRHLLRRRHISPVSSGGVRDH